MGLEAAHDLQQRLPKTPTEGKMYGVLVVENKGQVGYLQAYSGQIEADDEDFVPAIFDYLKPDGYFKTHEAEITNLNNKIENLKASTSYQQTKEQLRMLEEEAKACIEMKRQAMKKAKTKRDERKKIGNILEEERLEMVKESQFLKAEVHRTKRTYEEKIARINNIIKDFEEQISAWQRERKLRSDHLQRWLFAQFNLLNAEGNSKNLLDIFREYYLLNSPARTKAAQRSIAEMTTALSLLPPSGAGECCEPKLLQYAFSHNYRPISMVMFWWGPSPKTEIRQHGYYYPPCNGKCKPILTWMLRGLIDVEAKMKGRYAYQHANENMEVCYEDEFLAVINKPNGMLSVPGKNGQSSVFDCLKERWKGSNEPLMVHRLDMATSGLFVVARTPDVHKALQAQFMERKVKKCYVALLPLSVLNHHFPKTGKIVLPLIADENDRPRQRVDKEKGKMAITLYEFGNKVRYGVHQEEAIKIYLYPLTGRTHQLRVHCAHMEGLKTPIIGDTLYGKGDERLWLHAEKLTFQHPITLKQLSFHSPLKLD